MVDNLKKFLFSLIIVISLIFPLNVKALEKVRLYLFYSDTCPHCSAEREFLDKLENKYDYLQIHEYEITKEETKILLKKVFEKLDYSTTSYPFTVIGSKYFKGYSKSVSYDIEDTIRYYSTFRHKDIVGEIEGFVDEFVGEEDPKESLSSNKYIPLLGEIDPKSISLPLVATILGFIDGFNPCAMWVLIFLITVLIGTKDRKKMWILGITFLLTSALIYLLFMVAWLNVALKVNQIRWLQLIVASIALIAGAYNLRSYFKTKNDNGCNVVESNNRKKIFYRIQKFAKEKSFFLSIIGIMGLAITVNLIELACSAGLPLLFTQILALNNLSNLMYALNIIIYIFFFLIDDLIIFIIAMFTFKVTGISTKYTKYFHLIGGIIMLLIATLMIFKPSILMFNF